MTTAIERAGAEREETTRPHVTEFTAADAGATDTSDGESIGQNLPPIPRAARGAVAGSRRRLRSVDRPAPTTGALVLAVSLSVLAAVVLLMVARSRRRSPAEELLARLEQVPERLSTPRL